MKKVFLIIVVTMFMYSCKTIGGMNFEVKAISPCEDYDVYFLRSGVNRITFKDTTNKYNIGDKFKIQLIKQQ